MNKEDKLSKFDIFMVYFSYGLIIVFCYASEFFDIITGRQSSQFRIKKEYSPLFNAWDSFYTRRLYYRIRDCWNRPVLGVPGSYVVVKERNIEDMDNGERKVETSKKCLNLGSYNYLAFSDNKGRCLEESQQALNKYGISTCSNQTDIGTSSLHRQVEIKTSKFLNKEDCIIFDMGYHTNAGTIPAFVDKNCLVISDSLNHASLVAGCRASGAKIKVFPHNNTDMLEKIVRESISEGQPQTRLPWKKILIIVEGIYSMEGAVCNLKDIVRIKKQYKCYLWVDEAHSIGALGKTGRGVCEHTGVDTADVDILMGTFTKSFASAGGYITGKKDVIDHLRKHSFGSLYSTTMSPACCQQIITSMGIIMGEDGTDEGINKIKQLHDNGNYFRRELIKRGFKISGEDDSPIIPLMLYYPAKISAFSREALSRGIAVVVVGYPATPLLLSRTRFCVSAGHTKDDLDWAIKEIDDIGDRLKLKYLKN
jgi:serine palmitoyltransferase